MKKQVMLIGMTLALATTANAVCTPLYVQTINNLARNANEQKIVGNVGGTLATVIGAGISMTEDAPGAKQTGMGIISTMGGASTSAYAAGKVEKTKLSMGPVQASLTILEEAEAGNGLRLQQLKQTIAEHFAQETKVGQFLRENLTTADIADAIREANEGPDIFCKAGKLYSEESILSYLKNLFEEQTQITLRDSK